MLKALERLLATERLKVEKFSDPASFIEYARHHPVPLALIDLHMPGMSGLEVLAELRGGSSSPPVIVLTADNDPAQRTAAMEGGASAFFTKPFDGEAVLSAVHAALT